MKEVGNEGVRRKLRKGAIISESKRIGRRRVRAKKVKGKKERERKG